MIDIFFLVRSLENGGAEQQLIQLIRRLDKRRFRTTVATFYDGGTLRPQLEGVEGVRLTSLGKKRRWDVLPFLVRLWRTLRCSRPHIVHGYMGVANELALVTGRLAGRRVVWGLRASYVEFSRFDWAASWSFRIAARLSRLADLIIVNSWAGLDHHVRKGYSRARMVVIPNGIDTALFRPCREMGTAVRAEWGVVPQVEMVGLVGRLDPMKDHPNFLRAAAALVKTRRSARFVSVGGGAAPYREELVRLSRDLGLGESFIWAGPRSDMSEIYNALDVLVLSSSGEGFPNVVGEAMACGVPCVVTDVGDAARIVGDTGIVVPARDPEALARAIEAMLEDPDRASRGRAARRRIEEQFSAERLVAATEAALERLVE